MVGVECELPPWPLANVAIVSGYLDGGNLRALLCVAVKVYLQHNSLAQALPLTIVGV